MKRKSLGIVGLIQQNYYDFLCVSLSSFQFIHSFEFDSSFCEILIWMFNPHTEIYPTISVSFLNRATRFNNQNNRIPLTHCFKFLQSQWLRSGSSRRTREETCILPPWLSRHTYPYAWGNAINMHRCFTISWTLRRKWMLLLKWSWLMPYSIHQS